MDNEKNAMDELAERRSKLMEKIVKSREGQDKALTESKSRSDRLEKELDEKMDKIAELNAQYLRQKEMESSEEYMQEQLTKALLRRTALLYALYKMSKNNSDES